MNSKNYRCCNRKPSFSIVYSVAGEQKPYDVCSHCIELSCFSKFILEKVSITASNNLEKNSTKDSQEQLT